MKLVDTPEVESLLKRFDIPPCPAVINELRSALASEDVSIASVARLISRDVGLAGAVMRIVNSPAFGLRREVGSIDAALNVLGLGRVFDLVVAQLLKTSLGTASGARLERYWDNAACTADLCAALATRLPGTTRETAYCFGLFHDCGIPLMLRRFPDYDRTLARSDAGDSLPEVEEERHGTNHADVGYLLARSWGLSRRLCEAIRSHHHDVGLENGMTAGLDDEVCALIGICMLAEHVSSLHLHMGGEADSQRVRASIGAFFGLSAGEVDDLVDDLLAELQRQGTA